MAEVPARSVNYNVLLDYNYLLKMAHRCANGVRWKPSVQRFEINKQRWVSSLYKQLEERNFETKGFYQFWLMERGKRRFIQSVHISERTVQKALSNGILKEAILPSLIYDNSASVKGKGTAFAIKRLKQHLTRYYRKYGRKGGILILDFKNYFDSINHKLLIKNMNKYIKDEESLSLLKKFIYCFDGDIGIGLGSEVCQIMAISFPNRIDHFIQNHKEVSAYARFMDDSYVISHDIEFLKKILIEIEKKCQELGLRLNKKRTIIVKLNKGSFTYLKKRFYLEENGKVIVRLSRESISRQRKKMKRQAKLLGEGRLNMKNIHQSYLSWRGMAKQYNSYRTIHEMDKLYVRLFKEEF